MKNKYIIILSTVLSAITLSSCVNDLDVKELPAGTYMLKVRNIGDNTDSITKILIKH